MGVRILITTLLLTTAGCATARPASLTPEERERLEWYREAGLRGRELYCGGEAGRHAPRIPLDQRGSAEHAQFVECPEQDSAAAPQALR